MWIDGGQRERDGTKAGRKEQGKTGKQKKTLKVDNYISKKNKTKKKTCRSTNSGEMNWHM